MLIRKAFRFRIRPTAKQRLVMQQTADVVRYVWNNALELQQTRMRRHDPLLGYAGLCRELTLARQTPELSFLTRVHSKPQQQKLKDLARAFSDFFKGTRGFPKFKKKGRHEAFRFPQSQGCIQLEGNRVKLPALGWVRFRKSREVEGEIKNATLSKRAGDWFISLQTELELPEPVHPATDEVGIDVGVAKFAALSNGEVIEPANSFRRLESKLARYQRVLSRKKKYSNNWKKQRAKIAKLHLQIADARRDFLHKVSTAISNSHALVVVEDLRVSAMSRSAKGTLEKPGRSVRAKSGLNKSILDQGWYEFRRQLEYKQLWRGGRLLCVPAHGTSQRCSLCGHVSADSRRSQSLFVCVGCGHREDADINAAKNILAAGHAATACGEDAARSSVKQEPLAA